MKLVRMVAAVLFVVAIILYFTEKEYALYVGIVGFALIALINIPLILWIAYQQRKMNDRNNDL